MKKKVVSFCVLAACYGVLLGSNSGPLAYETMENWEARLEIARSYSYKKDYANAVREYKEVLKERPSDESVWFELASVYAQLGDRKEAKEALSHVKRRETAEELKKIALIYTMLKDFPEAESAYEQYLSEKPEDLRARLKYAELLSWQRKYTDSLKQYEVVLKERPDDIQIRRKYALVLIWMGKDQEGAEEMKKTLNEK